MGLETSCVKCSLFDKVNPESKLNLMKRVYKKRASICDALCTSVGLTGVLKREKQNWLRRCCRIARTVVSSQQSAVSSAVSCLLCTAFPSYNCVTSNE
jgi:hypothetical protein